MGDDKDVEVKVKGVARGGVGRLEGATEEEEREEGVIKGDAKSELCKVREKGKKVR